MIVNDGDLLWEQIVEPEGTRTAEHELVGELVTDAVRVLVGLAPATLLQKQRDMVWLGSDSVAPFSFLWACRILDLNAKAIREKVRQYGQARSA